MSLYRALMELRALQERREPETHHEFTGLSDEQAAAVDETSEPAACVESERRAA